MKTMKDLVRGIFGEDAANDPEIVSWYEDVNKEVVAENAIGFGEWIKESGYIINETYGWMKYNDLPPNKTTDQLYNEYLKSK